MIKLTDLLKETLTEVSLDQLKTQLVDSGKMSEEDFNKIVDVTPKTAYITWLAKKVADKIIKAEDIYQYKKYFNTFDRYKKEYPFTDINQYKTQNDVSQFINKSVEIANKESEDPSQQKGVSKENKYKEFYLGSVSGFNVYKLPQGRKDLYGTSCELGSGTGWCTATGKDREDFDRYISQGPLFIFINPKNGEKYQFLYEGKQFMDKDNKSVNIDKKIYNLFKFIENKEPQYKSPFAAKLTYEPEILTPEDLNVKGDLNLEKNDQIFSLPNNLKVEGNLNLKGSSIRFLPDNLKVGGDLDLSRAYNIDSLPENLEANKLNLYQTKIKTIPSSLKVKILLAGGSSVSFIPKDLVADVINIGMTPLIEALRFKFNSDFLLINNFLKNTYPGVGKWE
jgi:hypothetical protein